jgi:Putative ATPase subunit of terminase (gpP-like).
LDTYTVKQIADMLNTDPETVRRWIRKGKLHAEKTSRKEGNIVTVADLNKFLKSSPKYAGMAAGAMVAGVTAPIAAIPLVGGIAATYLTAIKKQEEGEKTISREEIKRYLAEEIERRNSSIQQKLSTIEHIRQEIVYDQQQIAECSYVIERIENEEGHE